MPDFDKLFAKRLGEDNYKSISDFLGGKVTFNELEKGSQNVLNGLGKKEEDRTFTQQEQLYELKQKLVTNRLIAPDSDAWDHFEMVYRKFMLGREARNRFYKLQQRWTGLGEESGKQKWIDRMEKDFQEDLRLGNLDEYKNMSMSEIKNKYIEGYTEWLKDPSNNELEGIEYRKDLGIKQEVELTELPTSKISKVTKFKPLEEP